LAQAVINKQFEGCAILDSGASIGMTSDNVLQTMNDAYRAEGKGLYSDSTTLEKSNTTITVANGDTVRCGFSVPIQPIPNSPFAGREYRVTVNANNPDSSSPMLIGSDYLRAHRCIVDFDLGVLIYKDEPEIVHHLRIGRNGHTLLMPITRDQCEKHYYQTNLKDSHDPVLKATVASLVDR